MLCVLVSLFTNSTRDPWLTVTWDGLAPADVIVTVAAAVPVPGEGADGPPPQPLSATSAVQNTTGRTARLSRSWGLGVDPPY